MRAPVALFAFPCVAMTSPHRNPDDISPKRLPDRLPAQALMTGLAERAATQFPNQTKVDEFRNRYVNYGRGNYIRAQQLRPG